MRVVEAAFLATLLSYLTSSLVIVESVSSSFVVSSTYIQDTNETAHQPRPEVVKLARTTRRANSKSLHNKLPEFSAPIGNITAILGRDVRLICTVEHLGQYQVSDLEMR